MKNKVFLDLDGTLIRSYSDHEQKFFPESLQEQCIKSNFKNIVVVPRRGLVEFLVDLNKNNDVMLLTAAHLDYANAIAEACQITCCFTEIHSTTREIPNSLCVKYDLKNCPWILVDDTPHNIPLTAFKLNCLGLINGGEDNKELLDKHFIHIESFQPHSHKGEHLDQILVRIKSRLTC